MFPFNFNNNNINNKTNRNQFNRNNGYNMNFSSNSSLDYSMGDIIDKFAETVLSGTTILANTINNMMDNENFSNAFNGKLNSKIIEDGDKYTIRAKLIGVQKKDIDIDYENDHLRIKVKRDMTFSNGSTFFVQIQTTGSDLESSFYVPNVDENKIRATYNSKIGLLKVIMMKKHKTLETFNFNNDIETFNEIIDVEDYTEV